MKTKKQITQQITQGQIKDIFQELSFDWRKMNDIKRADSRDGYLRYRSGSLIAGIILGNEVIKQWEKEEYKIKPE